MPALAQSIRSSSEALAVIATMGTDAKTPPISRIFRVASMPSMLGICMSIRTTSNRPSETLVSASSPSEATTTSCPRCRRKPSATC